MGYTRKLTKEEKDFCQSLGGIVIFWNHVENSMRILLQRATVNGSMEHRLMVLISNLGNVSISEAMTAIADDHRVERMQHLKHCAKLFDAERIYRNYYVHNPVTFHTRGKESQTVAMHITAKGGALKKHDAFITKAQLNEFHDRLSVLQNYIGELIEDSINLRNGKPLSSLEMPPLPDKLELPRLRLIEP